MLLKLLAAAKKTMVGRSLSAIVSRIPSISILIPAPQECFECFD
jgi:hypothetical protein